jgi:hypothetical protein
VKTKIETGDFDRTPQLARRSFMMVMKEVDRLGLSVYAFRLYWRLVCMAEAPGDSSTRGLAQACKMAIGSVSKAKRELIAFGLIDIDTSGIRILDIANIKDNQLAANRRLNARGYIYLLKCGEYFKIGKSQRLRQRLDHFQTVYPHHLEVVVTARVAGVDAIERQLHQQYQAKRHKGEWFTLAQQDVTDIVEMLKAASIDGV